MPLMPMPPIPMKWMGPISRGSLMVRPVLLVMPGLIPGIHESPYFMQDVDGRDKPGHDGKTMKNREFSCHSGAMRQHRARNLEIPGSHFVRPGMTPASDSGHFRHQIGQPLGGV